MDLLRFDGHIVGASFASGDTIVAGRWRDVAVRPLRRRDVAARRRPPVVLAPTAPVLDFVTSHYTFDGAVDAPVRIERDADGTVRVTGGGIDMALRAGASTSPGG